MRIPFQANLLALAIVVGSATLLVARLDRKIVPNLATFAAVTTSSRESGSPDPGHVIDGDISLVGFHTRWEQNPWVLLDLHSEELVRHVIIYNRLDCCCERAVPLLIEFSHDGQAFTEVARMGEVFEKWDAQIPPQRTRFIRAESPKFGVLHLNEIVVR